MPDLFPGGAFIVSLDFEMIWGTRDYAGPERFRKVCEIERSVIIDRLLELLIKYEVSATWLIVGHLFLDRCEAVDGKKHPTVVPPEADWFADDPATDEQSAPTFYGRSLVEKIRRCPISQEIGCHSFSHVIFDAPECTRAVAESEIAECVAVARQQGTRLQSFAFPRNRVGHLDILHPHGFTSYRGPEAHWYTAAWIPSPLQSIGHLASVFAAITPPTVAPHFERGIWNIPGSMIFLSMSGIRRYIPASRRAVRAIKGLRRAVAESRIFHLWFHPTNMADEIESMFEALEKVFQEADRLRRVNGLEVLTMEQVVTRADAAAERER